MLGLISPGSAKADDGN